MVDPDAVRWAWIIGRTKVLTVDVGLLVGLVTARTRRTMTIACGELGPKRRAR